MFNEFEKTKNWIENIKKFGSRLDLSRISKVLEELGNPQNDFKTIHVAGTNGKGSTASYIKSILLQAGYKVGIYTSPYVVKFNERISVNDTYISDSDVIKYANIVFPIWERLYKLGDVVTFFEVLTVICFLYFRDQKIDFGVIEVGLGGTLDATNVIVPEISVITNISYDHMNVLGNTLEAIALNKLGIVKPNIPLVTTVEKKELVPLFKEVTRKNNSKLTIIDQSDIEIKDISEVTKFGYKGKEYQTNLPGVFQIKNASLAVETILQLRDSTNLDVSDKDIKLGLVNTKWPGRFEIFNHNIILDGAHNIGGIEALSKTITKIYPEKYVKCLVSIMFDKEHEKIIEVLDNVCDEIYFTEFEYTRRADAEILYDESHHKNKKIVKDYKAVFSKLSNLKKNEILVVTGSLYFISEIRKLLIK
ncbi:folylpolyglutamate synthase/dihydrofolate synthase family protein [Candidatus Izemoplasma sp. B36]|uniref:bifunctional folylpolyglutamate synthase/dihydrofolate synthase n=1 Tax=Candidatus Izemoplasma sp. B36 TaxID=3242468 RepID=UPI0035562918